VPEIDFPDAYRRAVLALVELDDDRFLRLANDLDDAPQFQPVHVLIEIAQRSFPTSGASHADGLIRAVLSMRGQLRNATPQGIAAAVASSIDIAEPDTQRQLEERLERLLLSLALTSTAYAIELMTQYHRNFGSVRVLTDIRPVFVEDAQNEPAGVVLTETLQLQTWGRDGETQTLFVGLDEADLVEMAQVIDRALTKAETIKEMLARQGTTLFEMDPKPL